VRVHSQRAAVAVAAAVAQPAPVPAPSPRGHGALHRHPQPQRPAQSQRSGLHVGAAVAAAQAAVGGGEQSDPPPVNQQEVQPDLGVDDDATSGGRSKAKDDQGRDGGIDSKRAGAKAAGRDADISSQPADIGHSPAVDVKTDGFEAKDVDHTARPIRRLQEADVDFDYKLLLTPGGSRQSVQQGTVVGRSRQVTAAGGLSEAFWNEPIVRCLKKICFM
jgi:hypothetical protein